MGTVTYRGARNLNYLRYGFATVGSVSGGLVSSIVGANYCWAEIVVRPSKGGDFARKSLGTKLSLEEVHKVYAGEITYQDIEKENEKKQREAIRAQLKQKELEELKKLSKEEREKLKKELKAEDSFDKE
eukprot:TRINITY_DN6254_c0_g1_i4.p1 TRINITY_DN6254_c0_g1~~TRINITY_DN6254_c0_g1_i4.p1  ORF type:complete len:129 (-),score=39.34 TRINITY_DN6254_c0_g1_i4:378-764(-)